MSKEKEEKDIDFILDNYVGGGGKWQWKILLIMFPVTWISGYPLFLDVYAAYTPVHRCYVDQCDSNTSAYNEDWLNIALPTGFCYDFFAYCRKVE